MARALEQFSIATISPNFNEDEFVRRPGMAPKFGETCRELIGSQIFIYDTETLCLVFKSDSIKYLADNSKIGRVTIVDCAKTGVLFLSRFLLLFEPLGEGYTEDLLSIDALAKLFEKERSSYNSWKFCENQP